jgi:hypothetical protein
MTKIYLPSGLFGDVRNMHFGFSCSTTSTIRSTSREKSGSLGTTLEKGEWHNKKLS